MLLVFMVPRAGIEPARPKARDFKSLVSTNSTISAWLILYIDFYFLGVCILGLLRLRESPTNIFTDVKISQAQLAIFPFRFVQRKIKLRFSNPTRKPRKCFSTRLKHTKSKTHYVSLFVCLRRVWDSNPRVEVLQTPVLTASPTRQ
jgi:hypothetical protein